MSMGTSRWLLCRKRRPDASVRLYCFPHSGGSPGEYLRWGDRLTDIEVLGLQYPGRGNRLTEPPFTRMGDLVDTIVAEVTFDAPFAFFGHSLGALTAYETSRTLRDSGHAQPELLFVSALRAPHVVHTRERKLDDSQLMRSIEKNFGPLSAAIYEDPELRQAILAHLRADSAILETYCSTPAPPLDFPFVVLGGELDEETAYLPTWADYSTHPLTQHILPGDHFYLRQEIDSVIRIIADSVRTSG